MKSNYSHITSLSRKTIAIHIVELAVDYICTSKAASKEALNYSSLQLGPQALHKLCTYTGDKYYQKQIIRALTSLYFQNSLPATGTIPTITQQTFQDAQKLNVTLNRGAIKNMLNLITDDNLPDESDKL